MRAAVLERHGDPSVVRVAELPVPAVSAGAVRVAMRAVALNRLDVWVREGWPGLKLAMPHIVCADGAGVVEAIGDGVRGFAPGDRVCINPTLVSDASAEQMPGRENLCDDAVILGEHAPGVAAEYVVVPARNLLLVPEAVSFEAAAAAGLVYVTAWHSLVVRGGLAAGETVLIIGAGGGVNTAYLQIAKHLGATAIVVGSSAERCAQAAALGADHTINRAEFENWSKAAYELTGRKGAHVVVDNVGAATLALSLRSVRRGGRILIVGNTSGYQVSIDTRYIFSKQISLIGSTMGSDADFRRVMGLVFAGALQPVMGAQMPLEAIEGAHRLMESGTVFGKIVLTL